MNTKVALIIEYGDSMTEQIVLNPLKQSICHFDVVKITGELSNYPIWISPIELGDNQYMYEITLMASQFDSGQIQKFLESIKEPLALDPRNRVRLIAGSYSIVITTSKSEGKWPGLEQVLRLICPLL